MSEHSARNINIRYQVVEAATVVEHFVKAYKVDLHDYEWFYDPAKQQFVFKLYVVEPTEAPDE